MGEKASAIFGSLDFGSVRLNEGSAIFHTCRRPKAQ